MMVICALSRFLHGRPLDPAPNACDQMESAVISTVASTPTIMSNE
jgi:hypothetical protein